tara:strand:+ start:864 stop:2003 length:1140 start_codon:yes stop_codon:yes gene_type:complete
MIVGIDCSRTRSGGGIEHIVNFIKNFDPTTLGIKKIHLWVFNEILDLLPKRSWLFVHTSTHINGNLFRQIFWQKFILPKLALNLDCSIFLNTDASTFLSFSPSVTMSRDALSFEPGEMQRYFPSIKYLRLLVIKYVQISSLKYSQGTIFLTNYHKNLIERYTGKLINSTVIPHGINKNFNGIAKQKFVKNKILNIIYVSNIALYKHQWNVVSALNTISDKLNTKINLILVGSSDNGKAQKLLNYAISSKSKNLNVTSLGHLNEKQIIENIKKSNIFVFASSCETISNTLIQGMASGLPIACSNRGPLPEVLGNNEFFFDPENVKSIENAIIKLIKNKDLRIKSIKNSRKRAKKYNWNMCAKSTYLHLIETKKKFENANI